MTNDENCDSKSAQHLIVQHNILNHEINDQGYRYQRISFRTVYDTLILRKKNSIEFSHQDTSPKNFANNKYVCNHFKKTNVFLNDYKNEYSKQDKFFRFWLNNPQLNILEKYRSLRESDIMQHISKSACIQSLSNTAIMVT